MNITNNSTQSELCAYYELERSKIQFYMQVGWRECPAGFTGIVGFANSTKNIYYVRNFNPNTKGRRQINFHRFDGPACINMSHYTETIKLNYYVYGQWLCDWEHAQIHEAWLTKDEELLNNTIGMVFAAKEYRKLNGI